MKNYLFMILLASITLTTAISASAQTDETTYRLSKDQIVINNDSYASRGGRSVKDITNIVATKENTLVTLTIPIAYDSHWISISSNTVLYDRRTGDKYFLRNMERGIPLNKVMWVDNVKGSLIDITFVFPPLKRGVYTVDFIELPNPELKCPDNGNGGWRFDNLRISDYNRYKKRGEIIK